MKLVGSGFVGGLLPLATTYLLARRDRGKRLHDLYADFMAAAYVVYATFPDIMRAARSGKDATLIPDGMDPLERARVRLLMVERDRTKQDQIEAIAKEAEEMHSSLVALGELSPTEDEQFDRKLNHWIKLGKLRTALFEALKGSLA